MIIRWLALFWPELLGVLLALFLAGLFVGRAAAAEEFAYWPPCGEPYADPRCPASAPDAGVAVPLRRIILEGGGNNVLPDDFRPCQAERHAVRCDKGLEP